MINDMITRILLYYATYALGFILMLLLSLFRCGVYGSSRARAAVYSVITFLSGFAGARIIGVVYNFLFSLKVIETDVKVDVLGAVIFTALFLLIAVYIEKFFLNRRQKQAAQNGTDAIAPIRTVSFRDTMDMMIPGSFLVFACIKFGCHIRGCCYGVEWSWGIHFPERDITLFPVQLFEFATLFLIVLTSILFQQTNVFRRGMTGPFAANLYGVARFFWEFFRYNTPEMRHFLFGMTQWQLFSILVIVVSAVWLAVLYKTRPAEPLPKGRLQLTAEEKLGIGKKKKKTAAKNSKNAAAHKGGKKKKPAAKRGKGKR